MVKIVDGGLQFSTVRGIISRAAAAAISLMQASKSHSVSVDSQKPKK
jgi:hypothetical protein